MSDFIASSDTSKPLRRRLLDAVQYRIIPILEGQQIWRAILVELPFQFPREVTVDFHPGAPLQAQYATGYPSHSVAHYWDSAKVHSSSAPYMGFSLSGELDWRIGITEQTARKTNCSENDYALLGIPKSTFFLMPPGVPYSCGQLEHWERPTVRESTTEIFWIRFIPQGALCHFCWLENGKLLSETDYFIPDPHLLFAAEALIDEFRQHGQNTPQVAGTLLLFLFYRLQNKLQSLQELRFGVKATADDLPPKALSASVFGYVETHLQEKITLEKIATHLFLSQGHLCRIFKTETGLTINQYITQQRLDRACSLLRGRSTMSIADVAKSVGYSENAHFTRLFTRHFGCSPLQFRQNHLREYHKKSKNITKYQKSPPANRQSHRRRGI